MNYKLNRLLIDIEKDEGKFINSLITCGILSCEYLEQMIILKENINLTINAIFYLNNINKEILVIKLMDLLNKLENNSDKIEKIKDIAILANHLKKDKDYSYTTFMITNKVIESKLAFMIYHYTSIYIKEASSDEINKLFEAIIKTENEYFIKRFINVVKANNDINSNLLEFNTNMSYNDLVKYYLENNRLAMIKNKDSFAYLFGIDNVKAKRKVL